MKKRFAIFAIIALVAMLTLGACKASGSSGSAVFGDDCVASFEEETLSLELPANPTTGYEWTCNIEPSQGAEVLGDDYQQDSSDGEATGVGGTQVYQIKFTQGGEYTISLDYARSWESSSDDLHYVVKAETSDKGIIETLECSD